MSRSAISQSMLVLTAALCTALVANPAQAKNKKALSKITCEEFLAYDVEVQPRITYWALAYADGSEATDAWLDVDSTEQLVPVIVEECKKAPKESFWKKLKAKFQSHKSAQSAQNAQ